MLNFALEYQNAIDKFTGDCANDLRSYKMDEKEWEIVKELHDVLKVHALALHYD